jgi:hypothetical protein
MHLFRIKTKYQTPRPPSVGNDQPGSPVISERRTRVSSPATSQSRLKNSVWQLLPFVGKVSER